MEGFVYQASSLQRRQRLGSEPSITVWHCPGAARLSSWKDATPAPRLYPTPLSATSPLFANRTPCAGDRVDAIEVAVFDCVQRVAGGKHVVATRKILFAYVFPRACCGIGLIQ
jgi:hypothetical protein